MKYIFAICTIFYFHPVIGQTAYELNSGWVCANVKNVNADGYLISGPGFSTANWIPATVPGTVLTTLLNNKLVPDPFYGMNNKAIKDIYETGNENYTWWFVKDFVEKKQGTEEVWLKLRGVNYKADVYLNGKKLNKQVHEGMLLRQQYNISSLLAKNGRNRLAIIVFPPDHPGNPNGGQGGDGTIARDLTAQYTAGWDWIQPVRDRNTGIWDKVTIKKTKRINLQHPHIKTLVPGKRFAEPARQDPAIIKVSAEIENPSPESITGLLQYRLAGVTIHKKVTIPGRATAEIQLPDYALKNPKLWWPNGYGEPFLYKLELEFVDQANTVLDKEIIDIGIRQIDNVWNHKTGSMQALVNGQPVFMKGGNWIISDAMLRFSRERYDAEIRYHRDMNLNLIRIWGGAITERPEFYEACDKYGLLVFQDFWFSGDCNGRWLDPMKKQDQWERRKYPDNHSLAIKIAADQIKMIRNHASLAFWCGGNEITPPDDILLPLRDSLIPLLDGTRYFFDFSNSDSMSLNTIGGNGDGPYNIQDIQTFWGQKTFPYNSEVGSVGVGDYASLERFIPEKNLVAPQYPGKTDSVWDYHKYISYGKYMDAYGTPKNARDFTMKAQLLNYDQYRGLMEGFSAHMWEWYTGVIIWKTQNPWTALRGQMYDYYLDVNACLYGLRKGGEPLHIMMNPVDSMLMLVNNGFTAHRNIMLEVKSVDVISGKDNLYSLSFNEIGASMSKKLFSISGYLRSLNKAGGVFVSLKLLRGDKSLLGENFYWLPGTDGKYTALQNIKTTALDMAVTTISEGKMKVVIRNNKDSPVAFFNRVALISKMTRQRILPAFYTDNYFSVLPGESKTIFIEYTGRQAPADLAVLVYGWNVDEQEAAIN